MNKSVKKIAIVTDWITHWGGAERILVKVMEMYPEAEVYTSVFFPERPEYFTGRKIHTSFIQYIPFLNRRHKLCMLLRPFAFSRFDFSKYDLVISSSSAEAKGIRTKGKTKHICYCHTPTRYLWSHSDQYKNFLEFGWLNWIAKLVIPLAFRIMKKSDYRAAQRPNVIIANSLTTQKRIKQYYDRESRIVYPFFNPVPSSSGEIQSLRSRIEGGPGIQADELREASSNKRNNPGLDFRLRRNDGQDYFVCLGRIVPYKRFDLAIEACNELNLPLKIFTNTKNPESERLQQISGPTVEWVFGASDREVADGLAGAQAFIMPQEEDFGIVSLEAMSHGTPVIAYGKGGATETVVDGISGVLFEHQTTESLVDAIHVFQTKKWYEEAIKKQSMLFSEERFEKGIRKVVEEVSAQNTKRKK